jgi:hypothetical protein
MPVLIKKDGDQMLSAAATYTDELSEEGDTKLFLYYNNAAYKKDKDRIHDLSEEQITVEVIAEISQLEILSTALNKDGIKLSSLSLEEDYVIGLQPVAKDGRKGLIYLSRSFKLNENLMLNRGR